MINKDEIIFTVDEDNNPIEPVARKKAHAEGIWHRTTDIIVVNSENQILVHKRSLLKDTGPGNWDGSFGGHILAGVEPVLGAVEELREEAGLEVKPEQLEFIGIAKHVRNNNREFRYGYIYRWDGDIATLQLEKDEVEEVRWFGLDEIVQSKDQKDWSPMPYLDGLLAKLGKI